VIDDRACGRDFLRGEVGNVHPGADFAGTSYTDFLLSAAMVCCEFTRRRLDPAYPFPGIGDRIYFAARGTADLIGTNTNLGILLLLEPLCRCEPGFTPLSNPSVGGRYDLRASLPAVLDGLTVRDAEEVYAAIRYVSPGGLGDAPEQDVRQKPTVTLLEAMRLAADRDQIARQYVTDYADVFDLGVPAFLDGLDRFGCVEAAIIHCQLAWLAAFPDSLIARKCGPAVAADVRDRAAAVVAAGGLATAEGRAAGVALDRHLRSDGNRLNPGTTADLVTACLFVALREGRVRPNHPFRWTVPDWL
jgi:triphosphoribosyl-dephospho-CoA synthase